MKIELNENRAVTRLIEKIARLTLRKISLLMKLISSIASAEYLSILTVFSNWCVSKGQTRTRLVKIWIHKSLAKQSKALHYKRKNSSLETLTFKKRSTNLDAIDIFIIALLQWKRTIDLLICFVLRSYSIVFFFLSFLALRAN